MREKNYVKEIIEITNRITNRIDIRVHDGG